MAPKLKDAASKAPVKKVTPQVVRPPISDSSLVYVPEDAVEGYQERIETGIDWTTLEAGARYHRMKCQRENMPTVPFSQALKYKVSNSVLGNFLDKNTTFTLEQLWDFQLPAAIWDNEKFATDEGKICFHNANCITDNVVNLIKEAVKKDDRKVLRKLMKRVTVLRVNDSQMTELDEGLRQYNKLLSLNLCGNYISHIDPLFIPHTLKSLELQANAISDVSHFADGLPQDLLYLGLSRNLLNSDGLDGLAQLPINLTVLDLSDNDICDLEYALKGIARLPYLTSLQMSGNPCSVSAGYSRYIILKLPRLQWLDCREILPADRKDTDVDVHPDDLRSANFYFTVIRIMSAPQPPKPEKGAITSFHVEFEVPLLDVARRRFLLFRQNEDLVEFLPPPEDDDMWSSARHSSLPQTSKVAIEPIDEESVITNIFDHLVRKNEREIHNYTTFESNRIQWSKIMNFQEPVLKLFCPDVVALRDTFRSAINVRLVYTVTYLPAKASKNEKKSAHALKLQQPGEFRVVLANMKLHLKNPDWSQPAQHFHWDDSLGTDDAIHWGDGDLAKKIGLASKDEDKMRRRCPFCTFQVLQYSQQPVKSPKPKQDVDAGARQSIPDNLTCQFSVGIETVRY